jgi:ribosomal protein L35
MKSHNLEKKPRKQKRGFRQDSPVAEGDARVINRLLGRR